MKTQLIVHPEELSAEWIDRAVKLGVNVIGLHPVGGKNARDSLIDLLAKLQTKEFRSLLDHATEKGLEIEYELHAGSFLAPRDLFDEHPEYYCEDENGQRTPKENFCPSSEEMLDLVVRNAVNLAKQLYRSSHNYYFWLDDSKYGSCHCEKCRKMSPSDQQLLVMNRILEGLKQYDPKAKLAYLAYFLCIEPPKTVKPAKDIFLEYAPYEKSLTLPVCEQAIGKELDDLLTVFPLEDAKILEYWFDNSLYSKYRKPPKEFVPNNELIRDDITYYSEKGFRYISSFACYFGKDYTDLYGEPDLSAFENRS